MPAGSLTKIISWSDHDWAKRFSTLFQNYMVESCLKNLSRLRNLLNLSFGEIMIGLRDFQLYSIKVYGLKLFEEDSLY